MRSNPTRIVAQRFDSHPLRFVRPPFHNLTLPQGDIREYNCRRGCVLPTGSGLRQHTESCVNPLPAAMEIAVIQLSHADDEPRNNEAHGYVRKQGQEDIRSGVWGYRSNYGDHVPSSSEEHN